MFYFGTLLLDKRADRETMHKPTLVSELKGECIVSIDCGMVWLFTDERRCTPCSIE